MTDPASLAGTFKTISRDDWHRLAETGLRGVDFERALVTHTLDDIRIEPIYERAGAASLKSARGASLWKIVQRMDHPVAKDANRQALVDLENGATGLTLVFFRGTYRARVRPTID